MQRPSMNPSFVQEDDGSSPPVRRKIPWRVLLKPFKVVIGVVTAVAWIVVIVLAVMAVLWATSILRR